MHRAHLSLFGVAFVTLAALGLAACPPVTSKTPIGTTVTAVRDPALDGVWKGHVAGDKANSYFTFLPQDDGTYSVIAVTPSSPKDKGGWLAFSAQTVSLGPYHYINARETFDSGKPATGAMADNTFPVLYRVNGDGALVLYIIDETQAKNAIKAGKIVGTVEDGQSGDVTLTAAPGDLDAYMGSADGRALFIKPLILLRHDK
jgi:hypothetical protein